MKRFFASATLLLLINCASAETATSPTVTIDTGILSGASAGDVVNFKGIPYAAPPIGARRWMPPEAPVPWTGTREATSFGPICPQPKRPNLAFAVGGNFPQSEDCLSLNVWAPKNAYHAPVMVWIHGGGHRFGSSAASFYDGTHFAQDGIVFVSINYRLGLLGYFAHPALTRAAAPDAPLGNYGQMDQIAALKWVQRNIAKFGGNPANVTVFGESAGGVSTLYLMATPSARGLFEKAIVESGGGWFDAQTLAQAEQDGIDFATRAGLPGADASLDQLRALPVDKLFDIPMKLGFGPFVDGRLIRESPTTAFANGDEARVPLIIGSNNFEASLMKSFSVRPAAVLAQASPAILAVYKTEATSDEALAQALFTDSVMGAPAHWIAGKASSGAPTYLYHFSYVPMIRRNMQPGAGHGSEIPFVFATGDDLAAHFGRTLTPQDSAMEHLVHSCWVGFAQTGKPGCNEKSWPAYNPSSDQLMEFGETRVGPVSGFRKAQYDALAARIPKSGNPGE
jgi:para-nitrobenzyl esterase